MAGGQCLVASGYACWLVAMAVGCWLASTDFCRPTTDCARVPHLGLEHSVQLLELEGLVNVIEAQCDHAIGAALTCRHECTVPSRTHCAFTNALCRHERTVPSRTHCAVTNALCRHVPSRTHCAFTNALCRHERTVPSSWRRWHASHTEYPTRPHCCPRKVSS